MDKSTCELDDERKERSGYPAAWKYQKKIFGTFISKKEKKSTHASVSVTILLPDGKYYKWALGIWRLFNT